MDPLDPLWTLLQLTARRSPGCPRGRTGRVEGREGRGRASARACAGRAARWAGGGSSAKARGGTYMMSRAAAATAGGGSGCLAVPHCGGASRRTVWRLEVRLGLRARRAHRRESRTSYVAGWPADALAHHPPAGWCARRAWGLGVRESLLYSHSCSSARQLQLSMLLILARPMQRQPLVPFNYDL
jgi:hypothetical protein